MKKADCYFLGSINKIKGMKGEVSCYLDVDSPSEYKRMESVYVELNHELIPFFIDSIHLLKKNQATIKFQDIDSPEEAKQIIKTEMFLPLSALPSLKGNNFYYHEIIGFDVIDDKKGPIGKIESILNNNLQGIFQIQQNDIEILIPINDNIITKVDRKKKAISIVAPDGLIDLYL